MEAEENMSLAGRRILYISYNGMLDPLGQSQVIPYLKELSRLGIKFTLLSYERPHAYTEAGVQQCQHLDQELVAAGIDWRRLRYHRTPSLPATAYDVATGVRVAGRLIRQQRIELVHARSHIPGLIALQLKRRHGVRIIFDVRGLMAEEYIDAGHWQPRDTAARLTKQMEARTLKASDGVVTLTDALWREMQNWPALHETRAVHETIPCCIDLLSFRINAQVRAERRAGIGDRFVLVYSGSIGGWYQTNEMAAFFATLKRLRPNAFFLWLTQGDRSIVDAAMKAAGAGSGDYVVEAAAPREVPSWLSAADAGIAFYRPGFSRLGTSPVKVSEYLACGLPVIVNAGIGDTDRIIANERVGSLVEKFEETAYAKAATELLAMISRAPQRHIREVAEKLFDVRRVGVERYAKLYEQVLNAPIAG